MIRSLKANRRIWELFTKMEDYNPLFLDKHKRFPFYLSKYENILDPEASKFLIEKGFKVEYPDDRKFAVCLTHDMDKVSLSWRNRCSSFLGSASKFKLKSSFNDLFKKNPYLNFREIMKLEEKYNAKSSFYILTAERDISSEPLYDALNLKDELRHIIDRGWEVGLHSGYYSYNDISKIKCEKEKLEKIIGKRVVGCRNHYLRFKVPTTWELLKEAGFKYDTTFGYADCVGFRNGMCHPFKPFNLNTNKETDILEIPLTIMDTTLFDYMKLDIKMAWEITKWLINTVERYKGVITFLWHNTHTVDEKLELYERILRYCNERNAWMTSGEGIYYWWNDNNVR